MDIKTKIINLGLIGRQRNGKDYIADQIKDYLLKNPVQLYDQVSIISVRMADNLKKLSHSVFTSPECFERAFFSGKNFEECKNKLQAFLNFQHLQKSYFLENLKQITENYYSEIEKLHNKYSTSDFNILELSSQKTEQIFNQLQEKLKHMEETDKFFYTMRKSDKSVLEETHSDFQKFIPFLLDHLFDLKYSFILDLINSSELDAFEAYFDFEAEVKEKIFNIRFEEISEVLWFMCFTGGLFSQGDAINLNNELFNLLNKFNKPELDEIIKKEFEQFYNSETHFYEISPRIFQQIVGSNIFRKHFDHDFWVKLTKLVKDDKILKAVNSYNSSLFKSETKQQEQNTHLVVIICPDVRFENEAKIFDRCIYVANLDKDEDFNQIYQNSEDLKIKKDFEADFSKLHESEFFTEKTRLAVLNRCKNIDFKKTYCFTFDNNIYPITLFLNTEKNKDLVEKQLKLFSNELLMNY